MAEEIEVKSAEASSPRSAHSATEVKASSPRSPGRQRIKLTDQQLENFSKEELVTKWREQDLYLDCLESQTTTLEGTHSHHII